MPHHDCLLCRYCRGGQESGRRNEPLELKCQQIPDKDMVPVLVTFPHHKHYCVRLSDVCILDINYLDLERSKVIDQSQMLLDA